MSVDQIALGLLGVTAIFLTQSQDARRRRFACLFGLASQPFWFYATLHAQQWGILGLSVLYTLIWMRGFYYGWVKK